ncbi:MAG: hypothetical protein CVU44_16195 [Chloroflexi bacterium HGW-Chloroflexi-6]|nr:MAG: hypothetical protein CVU44_16195 [Chloroflexi bacterium HGW-Chloroflexi-6]
MKKIFLLTCVLLVAWGAFPQKAWAARGTPESPHFGYGLRVDVNGAQIEESLFLAAQMGLDWVALDFDWNAAWPDPSRWDSSTPFGRAARLADNLGLTLVFSISNPPAWAMTPAGPHPELTAALLCDLKQLFPNLQAVELYPRANTLAGWGAQPDPVRYAALLQVAQERLERKQLAILLLAGGLTNRTSALEDQPDTVFLQGLYAAGATPQVVSLRIEQISGSPLDEPEASSLRHFEQIRAVMNANHQEKSLIWVTGFDLPAELVTADVQIQSDWLAQAYGLMRSRLYFGASFYVCYNASTTGPVRACLLDRDGLSHPFLTRLGFLIGGN